MGRIKAARVLLQVRDNSSRRIPMFISLAIVLHVAFIGPNRAVAQLPKPIVRLHDVYSSECNIPKSLCSPCSHDTECLKRTKCCRVPGVGGCCSQNPDAPMPKRTFSISRCPAGIFVTRQECVTCDEHHECPGGFGCCEVLNIGGCCLPLQELKRARAAEYDKRNLQIENGKTIPQRREKQARTADVEKKAESGQTARSALLSALLESGQPVEYYQPYAEEKDIEVPFDYDDDRMEDSVHQRQNSVKGFHGVDEFGGGRGNTAHCPTGTPLRRGNCASCRSSTECSNGAQCCPFPGVGGCCFNPIHGSIIVSPPQNGMPYKGDSYRDYITEDYDANQDASREFYYKDPGSAVPNQNTATKGLCSTAKRITRDECHSCSGDTECIRGFQCCDVPHIGGCCVG